MGKEVCMFITEKDAMDLVEIIKSHGGIELDGKSNNFETNNKFFFVLPNSVLIYSSHNDEKRLNQIESDIIELSWSVPQSSQVLDVSIVEEQFKKGKFVVIDDSDKFHRLMSELQKNPVYVDNPNYIVNGYEHGRLWVETQYYDITGNIIYKNKKLTSLFLAVKRYIQRSYVWSTNKGWYIGPDAYQKYIDGKFVPCSGRTIIEFPGPIRKDRGRFCD